MHLGWDASYSIVHLTSLWLIWCSQYTQASLKLIAASQQSILVSFARTEHLFSTLTVKGFNWSLYTALYVLFKTLQQSVFLFSCYLNVIQRILTRMCPNYGLWLTHISHLEGEIIKFLIFHKEEKNKVWMLMALCCWKG